MPCSPPTHRWLVPHLGWRQEASASNGNTGPHLCCGRPILWSLNESRHGLGDVQFRLCLSLLCPHNGPYARPAHSTWGNERLAGVASPCFSISPVRIVAIPGGFEPPTYCLEGSIACLTMTANGIKCLTYPSDFIIF